MQRTMATDADIQLLTIEQYAALPNNGQPTELVRGKIVQMNPPAPRHGEVCGNVYWLVRSHVEPRKLGRVLSNDSGVITARSPDTLRGADVSYYSYDRIPPGPLPAGYLDISPNLVFEVRSQHDRWPDIRAKVAEYLNANVQIVCVLAPDQQTIHVFRTNQPVEILTETDEITLSGVLDDFRVAVNEFF